MRSSRPLSYCMHHTVFTTFFNRFLLVIMSSPAVDAYVKKVVETGNIWLLDHNCVVICTLDKSNRLSRKAVLITPTSFTSQQNYQLRETIFQCSCIEAEKEHLLISKAHVCFASTKQLECFADSRKEQYCIHALAALNENFLIRGEMSYWALINEHECDDNLANDGPVSFLLEVPKLIAVHDGLTWGVLGPFGARNGLVCLLSTCKEQKNRCSHRKKYIDHCEERDVDPELFTASTEEPLISVLSSKKIPFFPLPIELAHANHMLSSGLLRWPAQISPEQDTLENGHCPCEKQNSWTFEERVGIARIFTPSTIINKTIEGGVAKDIEVFVGKTDSCTCQLNADCQSLTLLNVDNKNFVSYSALSLFHAILGHGTPSCYIFANMLRSSYAWSSATESLSYSLVYKVIRSGDN